MVKARRIFIVLLILPIFGCFIGGAVGEWSSSTLRIKWQPLGTPPSKLVEILQTSPVLALGSDGNYYSYKSYKWISEEDVAIPEEDQDFDYLCEGVESPAIDNAVNIVEFCNPWGMGGLGYYYTKYALLKDGSVWKWEASHSGEGSPIPFIEPIIGSVIFLGIAFLVVLIFLFDDLLNNLSEKAKLDDN